MLPPSSPAAGDAPIRATDNDAAVARLSAVQRGYLTDPFIKHLVPRAHLQTPRPPLINIGTYVRTAAIDTLVDQWLEYSGNTGQKCQIVGLGAGSDTRYWRIASGPLSDNLKVYIEMDFPEITTKKTMAIKKSKDLMSGLGDPSQVVLAQGGTALHSTRYHLLPTDLRLDPFETLKTALASPSDSNDLLLDPSLPILLIFECVLVYMSPEASSRLLEWFIKFSRSHQRGVLGSLVYEMFGLNDAFGRVMVTNLKERGISLPGAEPYPTIESLPERFLQTGFSASRALTLKDIRKGYIDPEQLERISSLELLDETEELDLVLAHYAISWGLSLTTPDLGINWGRWGLVQNVD